MNKIYLIALALQLAAAAFSQDTSRTKLKVYIDCRAGCDLRYFKSEITIVDFVIDRTAADLHVLITSQPIGSAGRQFQLNFYGQNKFQNYIDTIYFNAERNSSASDVRQLLLRNVMFGMTPLLANTAFAPVITISMKDKRATRQIVQNSSNTADKWNYWVYTVSVDGRLNADQVYKTHVISSDFSAYRTTDKLKLNFSTYGSLNNTRYSYTERDSTTTYLVKNTDFGFYHYLVKSVTDHWSVGYYSSFSNNTFTNIRRKLYLRPSLEYNVFKFKDVNSRFLVIRYGVDISSLHYYDTTIFDKTDENRYGQKFSVTLTLNRKWGTINTGIHYRNFFKDANLSSMGINGRADVRVTGALSFYVDVNASIVHDQINLVKGGASKQEVLTRKRQVASNFNYRTSFGINFRFGSILNNFVNPRFEGYGGF